MRSSVFRRWARASRATAWVLAAAGTAAGCSFPGRPLPDGALIRDPIPPPQLPPPPPPAALPAAPAAAPPAAAPRPGSGPTAPLALGEVLASVETHFPLLYAVEQEREIAAGQRLAAEGLFDPVLRARGSEQAGTFAGGRLDVAVEQPVAAGGLSTFAGWRLGQGNFPIYYGDRKTADGGELRAGVTIPLLQNRDVDPRRARLRAAQVQEQLADPVVRRARLDYFRNAAQAYWTWQAAGAQYRVAAQLVDLALKRQEVVDVRQKEGLISASAPALNRRLIASRREALLAAERQVQQSAVRLSLFLRDAGGNPVVPPADWLLPDFLDLVPPPPDPAQLEADVAASLARRPELVRFRLEKERRAVELRLASNQELPTLNAFAGATQDVGYSKKTFTGTGPFATDRTNAEVGATLEVPLPRRDARGRVRAAQAYLAQLLGQERYARDEITAQVQDAVSELVQTYGRVGQVREEVREANRVLEIETALFERQRTSLFELNLQEIAAAEARVRAVTVLGLYFGAAANYLAVLGIDAPTPGVGGCVLRSTAPAAVTPPDPRPPGGSKFSAPQPLPPPQPVP